MHGTRMVSSMPSFLVHLHCPAARMRSELCTVPECEKKLPRAEGWALTGWGRTDPPLRVLGSVRLQHHSSARSCVTPPCTMRTLLLLLLAIGLAVLTTVHGQSNMHRGPRGRLSKTMTARKERFAGSRLHARRERLSRLGKPGLGGLRTAGDDKDDLPEDED